MLELGRAQWNAMQAGTWDDGLSVQAQLELEAQQSGATTLTAGQVKALSKAFRKEGQAGYEKAHGTEIEPNAPSQARSKL